MKPLSFIQGATLVAIIHCVAVWPVHAQNTCLHDTTGQYVAATMTFEGDGYVYRTEHPSGAWWHSDAWACYKVMYDPAAGYFGHFPEYQQYFPRCDLDGDGVFEWSEVMEIYNNPGPCEPPTTPAPDRVGIFSRLHNYFELDTPTNPVKFHFSQANFAWGETVHAFAGDFDGDGFDTIGLYHTVQRSFHMADANDSDEWFSRGSWAAISNAPSPPTPIGEGLGEAPVIGDWNGTGTDGLGVYHGGSNTFYLRHGTTSGPYDLMVTLSPAAGYPTGGVPLAGDFDGDGFDEVGLYASGVVYLAADLSGGPPAFEYTVSGSTAVAGDFDGDGTDTVAAFDDTSNTFTAFDVHGAPATQTTMFGYAEALYWYWSPLAGNWQVPSSPVASTGFDWNIAPPAAHNVNPTAFSQALNKGASIYHVQSVLVARHGELIGERYYHGYDRHIAGNVKSASKSILSAIYGIAFDQGVLGDIYDTVASYLPTYFEGLSAPLKQGITLANLLNMRAGLDWDEGTDVNLMRGTNDFVAYTLGQPMVANPGTGWEYNTGLTHMASAILTEAAGQPTRDYGRTQLFDPLGISVPRWDTSPEGYDIGGSELWMRPRDMARFGQLFLDNGVANSRQIVPQLWVETSADPQVQLSSENYGNWWRERTWTNYVNLKGELETDSYFAWGHGGQFIFLFPSWDLVVVITSRWNVNQQQHISSTTKVWNFLNNDILPAITPEK